VDDGVIICISVTFEIIEREEEGLHGSKCGDRLGKGQAGDVHSHGVDIIAVYSVFVRLELGLGREVRAEKE
jgi:hypothetical protein